MRRPAVQLRPWALEMIGGIAEGWRPIPGEKRWEWRLLGAEVGVNREKARGEKYEKFEKKSVGLPNPGVISILED